MIRIILLKSTARCAPPVHFRTFLNAVHNFALNIPQVYPALQELIQLFLPDSVSEEIMWWMHRAEFR